MIFRNRYDIIKENNGGDIVFFEKDLLSFNILDVLELKQQNINMFNSGRNFNALSFRFRSDAVLMTKTEIHSMKDNYLSYFPARLD